MNPHFQKLACNVTNGEDVTGAVYEQRKGHIRLNIYYNFWLQCCC